MDKLNPSLKHHTFVGIFISLWIYFFTLYIKPFDGVNFNYDLWWTFLSIGFSLIAFISYFILSVFQDSVYQKIFKWNIVFEILFLFMFHFINLTFNYLYYKSPFLKGILTFSDFLYAYIKSAIIFTPILIFARIFILRFIPKEKKISVMIEEEKILTIRGEYKLDVLKIYKSELICISKSQNYIQVYYLQDGTLKSKLIRSSLKKTQNNLKFLVQVHRSHLINPSHFKSWKNQNIIFLTQIEIPVSKNYKDNLLSL